MSSTATLSVAEAAEYLGFSIPTIRNYIRDGRLPAARLGTKKLAIPRAAVEALVVPARSADDSAVASPDYIAALVAKAPALTAEQKARISAILGGAAQ